MAFRSISTNNSPATGLVVTPPAGIQDGDILIAWTVNDASSGATTWPPGFVEGASSPLSMSNWDASTFRYALKVASGESGNYTLTGATAVIGGVAAFSGRVQSTTPHRESGLATDAGAASPFSLPSAAFGSATSDVCDVAFIGIADGAVPAGDVDFAPPSGYTEDADICQTSTFERQFIFAHKDAVAAGETGSLSGTGTLAGSSAARAVFAIALQVSAPIEQEGFRFRNDDGSETAATWKAAQDTNVTHPLSTNLRLRMLLNATGDPASFPFRLDYKKSTDSIYVPVLLAQPSLSSSELTANASTSNVLTYATASVTLVAGRTYLIGIVHTDAASEQDLASVQTTGAAVVFSQVASVPFNTIASNVSRLEVWKAVPTADVTDTITITLNDAGTGCAWILREYIDAEVTLGTPATNNANAATSISATPGALAAPTSHQVAFAAHDLNSTADTASGTNWSSAGTGQSYNTPTTGLECAVNTSGTASQVTFSGAGSADRAVIALEVKQKPAQPILMSASANIAASGEATTAQLTAPSGKSTSDFVAGRIQDDENPADAVDITTDNYTELEWCLTAVSGVATNGDIYQFRATNNGTALDTYTVTPEWTVGSPGPTGTGSMAVPQPSIAASGLVKVIGTAALAVAVAMSGTGTNQQQVSGSGSVAVSAPALSGTGTVTAAGSVSGSGSLAVPRPSIAGTGTNQQQVTGSASLAVAPTIAASGVNQQQVTGSGSLAVPIPEWKFGDRIEVPVPSIAGTGTVANGVSGSGSLALAQPSIAASGTNTPPPVTGTGALTVAQPSLSGTGGQGTFIAGTGSLAVAQPAIAASGTNQQQVTGSGALAVARPAIAASGQERYQGTASLSVLPTFSASGINTPAPITGTGSLAVPVPSIDGIQTLQRALAISSASVGIGSSHSVQVQINPANHATISLDSDE